MWVVKNEQHIVVGEHGPVEVTHVAVDVVHLDINVITLHMFHLDDSVTFPSQKNSEIVVICNM